MVPWLNFDVGLVTVDRIAEPLKKQIESLFFFIK